MNISPHLKFVDCIGNNTGSIIKKIQDICIKENREDLYCIKDFCIKINGQLANINYFISELKKKIESNNMTYESLFDEALSMSYTLNKIEQETHNCAMCKGDHSGCYSTDDYLKNICEILYASEGYHKMDKYNNRIKKE